MYLLTIRLRTTPWLCPISTHHRPSDTNAVTRTFIRLIYQLRFTLIARHRLMCPQLAIDHRRRRLCRRRPCDS